jgi:hypothetical protein
VLKKQFVAKSAKTTHKMAESTVFQIGLHRPLKRIPLLGPAGTIPIRAENSVSEVLLENRIVAEAAN